jgi:hypothetical protein
MGFVVPTKKDVSSRLVKRVIVKTNQAYLAERTHVAFNRAGGAINCYIAFGGQRNWVDIASAELASKLCTIFAERWYKIACSPKRAFK